MKKSIGVDVSKGKLNVALYDGNDYLTQKEYLNSEEGIKQIVKLAIKHSCSVTMEATGNYHLKLANGLFQQKCSVSVVNPLIIKRFAQMKMMRAKTDKVDARIIALYGYQEEPRAFVPNSETREKIRLISEAIHDIIKTRTQYKNRLHALNNNPCTINEIKNYYEKLINELTCKIKEYEKKVELMIKEEFAVESEKIAQIPGVGKRAQAIVFGYLNGFENFENAKQVSAYVGLNPSPEKSGTSINGKGCISKRGNDYLRSIFYMLAFSAIKFNIPCKEYYVRIRGKGKSFKETMVAVANKLIRQIYAVVKYKKDYDPFYDNILREKYSKKV